MRDHYGDDYESVAGDDADRLIPNGVRKLTGAAVFIGLVGGLSAFGAIGMFLGPVIMALAIALLRFAEEAWGTDAA